MCVNALRAMGSRTLCPRRARVPQSQIVGVNRYPQQAGSCNTRQPRDAVQTEMRSFYCFVDWATTDLPGLDYAVAKAICTAAWSWLDHFHPEIGDEHGYPDFLVGTQPESWDQGAVQMEVEEGVLV